MDTVCTDQALDSALLDCNHDDHFHTNPASGSYLATHWNPANNQFLTGAEPPPVKPPPPPKKKHKKHKRR